MTTITHPTCNQAGALYGVVDDRSMLLQVFKDFDYGKMSLDMSALGRSHAYRGPLHDSFEVGSQLHSARMWAVESQKQFEYVFSTYFKAYKDPSQVRNKLRIDKLLLVPIELDKPIMPNDFGDLQK